MGEWLGTNGESIYGTCPTTIGQPGWGRCTVKGDRTYLHVFEWPADGTLAVTGVTRPVRQAHILTIAETLTFEQSSERLIIAVPREAPEPIDTVIVLEQ